MAGELVPFVLSPPVGQEPVRELDEVVETEVVCFTFAHQYLDYYLAYLEKLFADRDDIVLVDSGVTRKGQLGFMVVEWEGSEVDPLFLRLLEAEVPVVDICHYVRSEEVS